MRTLFLAFVLALVAVGCCKPVMVPTPPPPVVPEPTLRVVDLQPSASWPEITAAYKLDLADWVAYGRKLETLIWGKPTAAPSATAPKP